MRPPPLLALAFAVWPLVACGGAMADPRPSVTAVAAPVATPPGTAAVATDALATALQGEGDIEVALTEVRRAGADTVTVRWRYRNASGEDRWLAVGGDDHARPDGLAAAAFLLDPVHEKKYLVLTDETRAPVASRWPVEDGAVRLPAGDSVEAWAKFPAPPPGVHHVSIHLPGVAPFERVPITD